MSFRSSETVQVMAAAAAVQAARMASMIHSSPLHVKRGVLTAPVMEAVRVIVFSIRSL